MSCQGHDMQSQGRIQVIQSRIKLNKGQAYDDEVATHTLKITINGVKVTSHTSADSESDTDIPLPYSSPYSRETSKFFKVKSARGITRMLPSFTGGFRNLDKIDLRPRQSCTIGRETINLGKSCPRFQALQLTLLTTSFEPKS